MLNDTEEKQIKNSAVKEWVNFSLSNSFHLGNIKQYAKHYLRQMQIKTMNIPTISFPQNSSLKHESPKLTLSESM